MGRGPEELAVAQLVSSRRRAFDCSSNKHPSKCPWFDSRRREFPFSVCIPWKPYRCGYFTYYNISTEPFTSFRFELVILSALRGQQHCAKRPQHIVFKTCSLVVGHHDSISVIYAVSYRVCTGLDQYPTETGTERLGQTHTGKWVPNTTAGHYLCPKTTESAVYS